jgi:hypothetical protein
MNPWHIAHRFDRFGAQLADRHYSRQKPGSPQFVAAGSCLVLTTGGHGNGGALWVTSFPLEEWTRHEWAGAWICSLFRNEGAGRASDLIRHAVAATRDYYGEPPPLGMVTFVDASKVRPKRTPGHCFIIAGFRPCGQTKVRGLLALQMTPDRMPPASPAIGAQLGLLA